MNQLVFQFSIDDWERSETTLLNNNALIQMVICIFYWNDEFCQKIVKLTFHIHRKSNHLGKTDGFLIKHLPHPLTFWCFYFL